MPEYNLQSRFLDSGTADMFAYTVARFEYLQRTLRALGYRAEITGMEIGLVPFDIHGKLETDKLLDYVARIVITAFDFELR